MFSRLDNQRNTKIIKRAVNEDRVAAYKYTVRRTVFECFLVNAPGFKLINCTTCTVYEIEFTECR